MKVAAATARLETSQHGVLVGLRDGEIVATPLAEVATHGKVLDLSLFELARVLAI